MISEIQRGDLIFLIAETSAFGDAISSVQNGWKNLPIFHVAIALSAQEAIEASLDGVRVTSIKQLLSTASQFIRGIINPSFSTLIPKALEWAQSQKGKPYNDCFETGFERFYCSQLVIEAFRYAAGSAFFPEHPMNFRDRETGNFLPFWIEWYRERGKDIPQDEPGSHPATLSLSEKIHCVLVEKKEIVWTCQL